MSAITIKNLAKHFGDTRAVDGVSLAISDGDLFFLLGPSGCGKTTLLRMIAGFIEPTAGNIHFGEKNITPLPPHKRNTGMVFQSYALWPHMTVLDNVAYGLSVRKVPISDRQSRALESLKLVQMDEYAKRKPNELSGGQQQRVALARALVIRPDVLLLDEPLSNLDAKLRLEMRSEIRRICKESGITTVYVTHDQKEALSMADRVAVLKDGKIIQEGPPRQLYEQPESRFVAEFLGETNLLEAEITGVEASMIEIKACGSTLSCPPPLSFSPAVGDRIHCSIRPEALNIAENEADSQILSGHRVESIYLGENAQHLVELPNGQIIRILENNPRPFSQSNEKVSLTAEQKDIVLLQL